MDIELQPVGEIGPGLLEGLQKGLRDAIGYTVSINPPVPVPQQACDAARGQYLADTIIEELYPFKKKGAYLLGVTGVNLFTPGRNFVFGEASPATEVAVISLYLLHGQGDIPDDGLLLQRALKEATHEIGHLLGMDHCSDGQCVMHFSGSLIDTDLKNAYFCSRCQPRLIP
jgi:archaemetzincin